jgi:hypothetical protein
MAKIADAVKMSLSEAIDPSDAEAIKAKMIAA